LPVVFIYTAGLREAGDVIEQEGIRRSRESLAKAELILHVLDASEPLSAADEKFFAEFGGKKQILVRNKIDLPQKLVLLTNLNTIVVDVCSLSGQGMEALKDAIKNLVWSGAVNAEAWQVAINSRHQEALARGREATVRAVAALREGIGLELVAEDLRIAANAVGEIVGKTTTEDLLDAIFSQFCIGK
jgi:tRNA modification GTPase